MLRSSRESSGRSSGRCIRCRLQQEYRPRPIQKLFFTKFSDNFIKKGKFTFFQSYPNKGLYYNFRGKRCACEVSHSATSCKLDVLGAESDGLEAKKRARSDLLAKTLV